MMLVLADIYFRIFIGEKGLNPICLQNIYVTVPPTHKFALARGQLASDSREIRNHSHSICVLTSSDWNVYLDVKNQMSIV